MENRTVTKVPYSQSHIKFFIRRTGTFPSNPQRRQNCLNLVAIPWGFNLLSFSLPHIYLQKLQNLLILHGSCSEFLAPEWLMTPPRSCNKELYLPNSIFFPSSLILENEKIDSKKEYQPKTDEQPEKFQHKHVTFGKVRSKWEEDLILAGMRQVS